jgi:hypothetical protein
VLRFGEMLDENSVRTHVFLVRDLYTVSEKRKHHQTHFSERTSAEEVPGLTPRIPGGKSRTDRVAQPVTGARASRVRS